MFNSPILDTAIGLVFIFLIYSLLATSINEAVSTLFGLRARMLKKGIVESMLANSPRKKWLWLDTAKRIGETILEPFKLIIGYKPIPNDKLGDKFYNHPLIKNYGYSNRNSIPSYISKENFSTILIEVLKDYWDKHQQAVIRYAKQKKIDINLKEAPTITKIYYLVEYLLSDDALNLKAQFKANQIDIDEETLQILQLHLKKSYLNLEIFTKKIEGWYDDSMDRISGWYKKQVQLWLFCIGLTIAICFNVDIIEIAGKISTDKDVRDKLVEMAIKEADALKDDPRVQTLQANPEKKDSIGKQQEEELNDLLAKSKGQRDSIKKELNGRIKDANNLLAVGWGDYGFKKDSQQYHKKYHYSYKQIKDSIIRQDQIVLKANDTLALYKKAFNVLYKSKQYRIKTHYILTNFYKGRKPLGFLLLAFGVCLGAPFWFDLLQKIIKVRATGKKETTENSGSNTVTENLPVQVTVNNNTNPEAVG